MSLLAPDHVRRKRVFAPAPRMDATHLFEKAGPELTVCVHGTKGFAVGVRSDGSAEWSHGGGDGPRRDVHHPDCFRTAASFYDDDEAREVLRAVLTRAEWDAVAFISVAADVAQPPPTDGAANAASSPTAMCSIEACCRVHPAFEPLDHHRLDPQMRRSARPRSAAGRPVSLAPTPRINR